MKAWVLEEKMKMVATTREMPTIQQGQALVRVTMAGICGSDVHFYRNGKIGDFLLEKPMILGHECCGVVEEICDDSCGLNVGDRVVIEPGYSCGKCRSCLEGRYNMCEKVFFMATPPDDGCFVEYVAWPTHMLLKMPDNMTDQEGALIEPFSCGMAAVERSGVKPGDTCVILGGGPIGLSVLKGLQARGAGKIIVVDLNPYRLKVAKEMGATRVVNSRDEDLMQAILAENNGTLADVAFETAGSPATYRILADCVKQGGTVVMQGMAPVDSIDMPMVRIVIREVNMVSVFRYANVFHKAMAMVGSGRVKLDDLITHQYTFDQLQEAFDLIVNQTEDCMKIMISY